LSAAISPFLKVSLRSWFFTCAWILRSARPIGGMHTSLNLTGSSLSIAFSAFQCGFFRNSRPWVRHLSLNDAYSFAWCSLFFSRPCLFFVCFLLWKLLLLALSALRAWRHSGVHSSLLFFFFSSRTSRVLKQFLPLFGP